MTKHYFIYTFGCAMNEYDTERIAASLEQIGYVPSDKVEDSEFIILNTCSVREKPQTKILSYLGKIKLLKDKNPNIVVGITGCVAQQEGDFFLKKNNTVNFVMGTDAISHVDKIIQRALNGERFSDTGVDTSSFEVESFNRKQSLSANVTVMKGCDKFCSYCIVPFVRGREVSRPTQDIVNEIKRLIDNGVKEVTLLGQNVNSYGKNLAEGADFADLLRIVNGIDGLERIRFITSYPKDFNDKMMEAMAESDKVCKYLHLPLQSGSDRILKAMKRYYTYDDYKENIEKARKLMPNIEFTSDFIVGFPGETEEDFSMTLRAIEEIGYDRIFAFNYSPRPGTKAAAIVDDLSTEVKSERLARLFDLQDKIYGKRLPLMENYIHKVLVTEEPVSGQPIIGTNESNRRVEFSSNQKPQYGEIVSVKVNNATRSCLYGEQIL